MFKCIALLRKRADISKDAFITYYETRHAVLITRLLLHLRVALPMSRS